MQPPQPLFEAGLEDPAVPLVEPLFDPALPLLEPVEPLLEPTEPLFDPREPLLEPSEPLVPEAAVWQLPLQLPKHFVEQSPVQDDLQPCDVDSFPIAAKLESIEFASLKSVAEKIVFTATVVLVPVEIKSTKPIVFL